MQDVMEQTIFALATGQVKSAVAIVRISGPMAKNVLGLFCKKSLNPRRAELLEILDPATSELLDVGLVVWFPRPHSYTGEDVVEFQLHGGMAVIAAVLSALSAIPGLRIAEQGEFTRRAFQNNKMSLESVEGLADLLDADTQYERRQALHQLQGILGNAAEIWRRDLVDVRALVEASLDFTDESDVPLEISQEVLSRLKAIQHSVLSSIRHAKRPEILRGGFLVLIAGPPNVGKSTLLNCLVQRDVAITSNFAGTTRDLIEVPLDLNGMRIVFIDSAGLRETEDPVERMGLSKMFTRAQFVNLILWLSDNNVDLPPSDLLSSPSAKVIPISTKSDLNTSQRGGIRISAVTGDGINSLLEIIELEAKSFFSQFEGAPVIRQRQLSVAELLLTYLENAQFNVTAGLIELCAEDLASATKCLASLVQGATVDDILDEVFHRFCLGK